MVPTCEVLMSKIIFTLKACVAQAASTEQTAASLFPEAIPACCLPRPGSHTSLKQPHIKAISTPYIYGLDMVLIWLCVKAATGQARPKCPPRWTLFALTARPEGAFTGGSVL